MRFRNSPVLLLAMVAGVALRAQVPLTAPVPLVTPSRAPSPGETALNLTAADRALDMGFPAIAAEMYRRLLGAPDGDRSRLTLGLATALLDDGRPVEAEQALQGFVGLRGAAWHLRAALAAMQQRKLDVARSELAATKADEVAASDRAWYFYLQGLLADAANDVNGAKDLYQQAEAAATSGLARARFVLAREQARLRLGPVTEAEAETHRARIRELLTDARRAGHGPAKLERTIHSVYVKDTISRWTKDVAVPRGQRAAEDAP